MRDSIQDYLILRRFDLTEDEARSIVPAGLLVAKLERWLSSLFSRRLLCEMYTAITGHEMDGLLLREPVARGQIRRGLSDAFRNKVLVALPSGPPRLKSGSGSNPVVMKAPLVVPLLSDRPGGRQAKPPVGEAHPPPSSKPKIQMDAAAQARVLRAAASSGVPFCEQCEKPSRSRA